MTLISLAFNSVFVQIRLGLSIDPFLNLRIRQDNVPVL